MSNPQVLIEHGVLISGILSKDTLGNKSGSLMHVVAMEFSPEVARDFYGNIQKLVNNYLLIEGHSIGIGDTIADTYTYNDIQRTIRQAKVCLLLVLPCIHRIITIMYNSHFTVYCIESLTMSFTPSPPPE